MVILLKVLSYLTKSFIFAGLEEQDDVSPAVTNTSLASRGTRRQTYQHLYNENQSKSYTSNFG